MKAARLLLVSLLGVACVTTPVAEEAPVAPAPPPLPAWTRTPPPPARPVAPPVEPASREWWLPNGLRVIVVEHHRRPLVSLRLFFDEGAAADPQAEAGTTALAIALLGDTFDHKDVEVFDEPSADRQVTRAGASYSFDVSADQGWIGIDGYAREAERYLRMLHRMVTVPRCSEAMFRARAESYLNVLEDAKQSPEAAFADFVTRRAFRGRKGYARDVIGTQRSLTDLRFEDVQKRQDELVSPARATLLIAGDVDARALQVRTERLFSSWENPYPRRVKATARPVAASRRSQGQQAALVKRTPASTTLICAARPVPARDHTGVAAELAVRILDGRLSTVLREQRGLTYEVSAGITRHRDASALIACSTLRTVELVEGLTLFSTTVKGLATTPPTPDELQWAKASVAAELRAWPEELTSIVSAWGRALARGEKSPSVVHRHRQLYAATAEEVHAAAARLLAGGSMEWVLSGDPQQILPAVKGSTLGWRIVEL